MYSIARTAVFIPYQDSSAWLPGSKCYDFYWCHVICRVDGCQRKIFGVQTRLIDSGSYSDCHNVLCRNTTWRLVSASKKRAVKKIGTVEMKLREKFCFWSSGDAINGPEGGVGWGFMINRALHLGFGRRKTLLYWALLVNLAWLCWRQARYTWYFLRLEPSKFEQTLSGLVCYSLSQSQDVVAFKATVHRQGIR